MMVKTKLLISLIFPFLFINLTLFCQNPIEYKNKVYKEKIKTVIFHQIGERFSYPIIEIEKQNELLLTFDDLNDDIVDYSYTIIHCNSDWEPSNLNAIEYINGFEENQLTEYDNSFNTMVSYRHFQLIIPNENVKPMLSGNYILLVYEGYDRDNIVLSQRFYVIDSKVRIEAEIKRSTVVNSIDDSQEIKFNIYDISNVIFNSEDNLKVTVSQNNNQYIDLKNIKPDFIKSNMYEYNNSRILRFKGGNEYRYFNVKSIKYVNDRIKSIAFNKPYYFFELVTEQSEAFNSYTYAPDINGEMLITSDNTEQDYLEAEYVYVDFKIRYSNPISKGKLYVYGALTNWDINKNNEMYYDFGNQSYNLRLLLKQGFYNYQYVFVENSKKEIDFSFTEGNHYQTENDYIILVYYKDQSNQYDELIAYQIINSLKKL